METFIWIVEGFILGSLILGGKMVIDTRRADPKGDPTPPEFQAVPAADRRRDERVKSEPATLSDEDRRRDNLSDDWTDLGYFDGR